MFTQDKLFASLREAGMRDVPERFSVAGVHQEIPSAILSEIEAFIRVFDRVTGRQAWQEAALAPGPAVVKSPHPETCFFSAWDFHIPPGHPENWQLIEFNDNGSGFVFAALLNHCYYELAELGRYRPIEPPVDYPSFAERIATMIQSEADSFFGSPLPGHVLIVDDSDSLETGRFRYELQLLRDLCKAAGWGAEIAPPADTAWDGARLSCRDKPVAFVVNRSTDFFWEQEHFAALRSAHASPNVYVAPNPFTYTTRSDKRLLQWLSSPNRDGELGIRPEERKLLSAHVPETHLLREQIVDELVLSRNDWFFKPSHGFGSHGLLTGAQVGRTRLRRLLKKGPPYVAQRRAPKTRLDATDGSSLWVDLRVWAYRGERYLLSGRASRNADGVDLSPPGGWVPTYAAVADHCPPFDAPGGP